MGIDPRSERHYEDLGDVGELQAGGFRSSGEEWDVAFVVGVVYVAPLVILKQNTPLCLAAEMLLTRFAAARVDVDVVVVVVVGRFEMATGY